MANNNTQDRSNLAALIRKLAALAELTFKLITSVRSEVTSLRSQLSWQTFSVSSISDSITTVKSELSNLRSRTNANTIQLDALTTATDPLQIYLISQTYGS